MSSFLHTFSRYQRKCDELELQMIDFTAQYNTLQKEKKDIVSFLKRSLAEKEDELTDLSERLESLEQAKNLEMELQDRQLRQEFQESKDKLTSENAELGEKLPIRTKLLISLLTNPE